jgi:hypothetical protein
MRQLPYEVQLPLSHFPAFTAKSLFLLHFSPNAL